MAAFTTIATGIGLAATAATTTMSFAQAGKQKRAAQDAERDAQAAMDAARKKLEINVFAAQGINKEPYALEREALLSAGAQAIEAGVESERGAAAVAGRIQMAQNEAQAQQTAAMSEEMTDLENKQLEEQSRLNDIGAQIDLADAQGAQQAAANYDEMANNAQTQGWQGVTNLAGQIAAAAPLYAKTGTQNTTIAPPTGNLSIARPTTQFNIGTAGQGQLSSLTPSTAMPSPNFTIGGQGNPNTVGGKIGLQAPSIQGVNVQGVNTLNPFLPYGVVEDTIQPVVAAKPKKVVVKKPKKVVVKK